MSTDRKLSNAKLGALVIAGLLFLVFSLYMIGRNQNILGKSMHVFVEMEDVNGLLPGNNVLYKGMNVGTVSDINVLDENTIQVDLLIRRKMTPFILKNARTTINTDGLIGNKILQIHPQDGESSPVEEGDVLIPLEQVGTEDMLRQLTSSGDYLQNTLVNLSEITEKINQNENLWDTLSDTLLLAEMKEAIRSFRLSGNQVTQMALAGKELLENIEKGDGLAGALISDSVMTASVERSLVQIESTTAETQLVLRHLNQLIGGVKAGEGTAGLILEDSLFRATLTQTLMNLESSTEKFDTNMEAMRSNFLFRRYFKRLEKEEKNAANQ
ncbi:phospholipid/cholesterol/gamma-HCH transport system substrate-binding protein [Cyclobacterium lianum]|uniref:Phospholipid/cholesterol/gamma-HCH transport system substrate-binding protein n=1 Tax=Cyclobacterium lianum TaxID=388280 RepID=A0A1M7QPS9_9BACT|nr:MlaD family protein [Cyclobacterium lianum]SHN33292.1 phospholipid/cholesterol/gamma-HCH transport system substrate-binding protein [Cyclobacterium lianum]